MRTLHLTTPLMQGDDVRAAQQRLRGSNVFRQNFTPGDVDGVYGPATMRAAKRAKFWLGYPTSEIDGGYGELLHARLAGKSLPVAYQIRRRARLRAKPAPPLRERALAEARTHVGTKEEPAGTNRVFFSTWYGLVGPWCAMFVSYCYVKAGSKTFAPGSRYAYVPFIVSDARAGRNNLAVTRTPAPGDLVCYDWDRDGVADHVGLFERWLDKDYLVALEGNTALDNNSNGGEVMERGSRHDRHRSEVIAFVHVGK